MSICKYRYVCVYIYLQISLSLHIYKSISIKMNTQLQNTTNTYRHISADIWNKPLTASWPSEQMSRKKLILEIKYLQLARTVDLSSCENRRSLHCYVGLPYCADVKCLIFCPWETWCTLCAYNLGTPVYNHRKGWCKRLFPCARANIILSWCISVQSSNPHMH